MKLLKNENYYLLDWLIEKVTHEERFYPDYETVLPFERLVEDLLAHQDEDDELI
jgi:hypothetical protein